MAHEINPIGHVELEASFYVDLARLDDPLWRQRLERAVQGLGAMAGAVSEVTVDIAVSRSEVMDDNPQEGVEITYAIDSIPENILATEVHELLRRTARSAGGRYAARHVRAVGNTLGRSGAKSVQALLAVGRERVWRSRQVGNKGFELVERAITGLGVEWIADPTPRQVACFCALADIPAWVLVPANFNLEEHDARHFTTKSVQQLLDTPEDELAEPNEMDVAKARELRCLAERYAADFLGEQQRLGIVRSPMNTEPGIVKPTPEQLEQLGRDLAQLLLDKITTLTPTNLRQLGTMLGNAGLKTPLSVLVAGIKGLRWMGGIGEKRLTAIRSVVEMSGLSLQEVMLPEQAAFFCEDLTQIPGLVAVVQPLSERANAGDAFPSVFRFEWFDCGILRQNFHWLYSADIGALAAKIVESPYYDGRGSDPQVAYESATFLREVVAAYCARFLAAQQRLFEGDSSGQ